VLSLGLGRRRGGHLLARVIGVSSCDQGDGRSARVVYACKWIRLAMSQSAGSANWREREQVLGAVCEQCIAPSRWQCEGWGAAELLIVDYEVVAYYAVVSTKQ
jgi:hypothetical protein